MLFVAVAWALVPARLGAHLGERIHFLVPTWSVAPYIAAGYWTECNSCTERVGPYVRQMYEAPEFLLAMVVLLFVVLGRRRLRLMAGDTSRVGESRRRV